MVERDEDGFLDRWSRRKRGGSGPGAPEPETAAAAPEPARPLGGRSDPPPAGARPAAGDPQRSEEDSDSGDPEVIAKLPDLDSLTEDTDFTVFLQDGVPKALRRQALRRLWRMNPVFANLDGLNDYDEDFSALGIIAENIKTIYKVGKGYLDDDGDEAEDGDEAQAEIAAGEAAEDEIEGAEAAAEPEPSAEPGAAPESDPESEPESGPPNPGEPIESTRISQVAPGLEPGPRAADDLKTTSEKPTRGSALARRWGRSPDQG
jgi:hypothetical protein